MLSKSSHILFACLLHLNLWMRWVACCMVHQTCASSSTSCFFFVILVFLNYCWIYLFGVVRCQLLAHWCFDRHTSMCAILNINIFIALHFIILLHLCILYYKYMNDEDMRLNCIWELRRQQMRLVWITIMQANMQWRVSDRLQLVLIITFDVFLMPNNIIMYT